MDDTKNSPPPTESAPRVQNQDVRQFLRDILSINVHIDEIRHFWAKELGVSGPQWMILMAVSDLNTGEGVPVKDVSAMLHVDPSFVTTQSKMLERNGFIQRVPSGQDARVVLMSLSEKAQTGIDTLAARRDALGDYILADFEDETLRELSQNMAKLKNRLHKAAVMLSIED